MPTRALRSRSLRQVKKKLPGGRVTTHFKRRKPKQASCASCRGKLQGVPAKRPAELKRMTKSQRKPNRPYGGHICFKCLQKKLVAGVRENV